MLDLRRHFIAEKRIRKKDCSPIRVMAFHRSPDLYCLFDMLGYTKGVEVGVRWGQNAGRMCQAIGSLQLTVVDPWEDYAGTDRLLTARKHQLYHREARKLLAPYNVTFMQRFSIDAAGEFGAGSIDFVYIDANHKFDYVMQDLITWSRKVRPGGMVSGHDFSNYAGEQVMEAVEYYAAAHRLGWFVTDEQDPSFFWRKP